MPRPTPAMKMEWRRRYFAGEATQHQLAAESGYNVSTISRAIAPPQYQRNGQGVMVATRTQQEQRNDRAVKTGIRSIGGTIERIVLLVGEFEGLEVEADTLPGKAALKREIRETLMALAKLLTLEGEVTEQAAGTGPGPVAEAYAEKLIRLCAISLASDSTVGGFERYTINESGINLLRDDSVHPIVLAKRGKA